MTVDFPEHHCPTRGCLMMSCVTAETGPTQMSQPNLITVHLSVVSNSAVVQLLHCAKPLLCLESVYALRHHRNTQITDTAELLFF